MGAVYGNMLRDTSDTGNERFIRNENGNHRASVWNSQGKPWLPLYTDVWESPDGDESRADICMYECKKVSKYKAKMGTFEYKKAVAFMFFSPKILYKIQNGDVK